MVACCIVDGCITLADAGCRPSGFCNAARCRLAYIPRPCYAARHRHPAGPIAMTDADRAASATPRGRSPNAPEGKARSSMNAQRHGLRARSFGILPGEEQAEWAEHLADLRAGYGPVDATEEKLVAAIATAMLNEVRADRTLAEVLPAIPPLIPGRPHGGDLQEPRHALSLNTALRYMTAASMASQRAQRAFLAHRKARCQGLLQFEPATPPDAANENRTNESTPAP